MQITVLPFTLMEKKEKYTTAYLKTTLQAEVVEQYIGII
jgi:hypothetical protein